MTTASHVSRDQSLLGAPPPPAIAWSVCAVILAAMGFVRLMLLHDAFLPIAYGVPLVLNLWLRNRPVLWIMTAGFVAIATTKNLLLLPPAPADEASHPVERLALIVFDTVAIAAILDAFMTARLSGERRNAELRAANVELSVRERTLQGLLSLSRRLTTDLTRQEMFQHVCDTLAELLDDTDYGVALLELEGNELIVRCGRGVAGGKADFGQPASRVVPSPRSFARRVLEQGQTQCIEDVAGHPELTLPPPSDGGSFRSVLAAPLRVGGRPVGTIEILGRQPGSFGQERVALIESVAAQASVSLEAAELFERVASQRNRFQAAFRFLPVGVTVLDGERAQTNPAGAAIFGLAANEDMLSKARAEGWTMCVGGQRLESSQWPIYRALSEGLETPPTEHEIVTASGRTIAVLIGAAPFKDARGQVVGAVAAYADVSPLKQLQRELDARRRDAEHASLRKTRFLAAVSHDIRTPANAIMLLAELIRRAADKGQLDPELSGLARELQDSAGGLVNLVGDVLDLARFDSGRIELRESEFGLADLLAHEQRRLQPLARQQGLELKISLPEGQPLRLKCDQIKLSRILENLIGNAIKFTPAGEVVIAAERDASGITRIRVIDTGVGMSEENQRHIFDEFFQISNPERDRSKGTGLGLTICKRLVDAMGGGLEVKSEAGKGSTFTLTLPAATAR